MKSYAKRHMIQLEVSLTVSTILVGCVAILPPAPAGFTRIDSGQNYVYHNPVWAPDASRIAYTRYDREDLEGKTDTGEIFVMSIDNRQEVQLTSNEVLDYQPAWAPDGKQIAYIRNDTSRSQFNPIDSLRIARTDRSGDVELYRCQAACGNPDWSPDGKWIAFNASDWSVIGSADNPPADVYVINVDGTGLTRLTQNANHATAPRWSPDGRLIAVKAEDKNEVLLINVADKTETAFDLKDFRITSPLTWSPDQTGVLFAAFDSQGRLALHFLSFAEGTTVPFFDPSSEFPPEAREPDWSHDGTRVVFILYNSGIYVADLSILRPNGFPRN